VRISGRLWHAFDASQRPLSIIGDHSTPANVVISTTSNTAFDLWGAQLYLDGVTIQTTTGGYGLLIRNHSALETGNIRFGNVASEMIACQYKSTMQASGTTDVVGDANSFCHVTRDVDIRNHAFEAGHEARDGVHDLVRDRAVSGFVGLDLLDEVSHCQMLVQ
jgi:hypothetical protein